MIRNVRQSILKNLHPSLNFKHSISLFSTLPCYKTDQITELGNNFTNSVDISVNLFFHNFVFVKRTINFTLALLLFKQNLEFFPVGFNNAIKLQQWVVRCLSANFSTPTSYSAHNSSKPLGGQ